MLNRLSFFFNPPFLRRLDHFLLINYRLVWVSKIHYLLFYGLLSAVLMAVFVQVYPSTLKDMPMPMEAALTTVSALLPFIGWWVYHQLVYNVVDQQYGVRFRGMAAVQLLLNLLCTLIFFGCCAWNGYLFHHRVISSVTDEQFIRDINTLNLGIHFFPSSWEQLSPQRIQAANHVHVFDNEKQQYVCGQECYATQYNFKPFYSYLRSDLWKTNQNIHEEFIAARITEARLKLISDFITTAAKYNIYIDKPATEILAGYEKEQYDKELLISNLKYKQGLRSIIYRIDEAKCLPMQHKYKYLAWPAIVLVIPVGLMMLLYMGFKRSVIAGISGFIPILIILMVDSRHAFALFLLIYALLWWQSLNIHSLKKFSLWNCCCLTVLAVMSFALLFITFKYVQFLNPELVSDNTNWRRLYESLAVVSSILFGYVPFMSVFQRLFLKLRSLPE